MFKREKIKELFLQERKIRLTQIGNKQKNSQEKLSSTLICFSLDKMHNEHPLSLKKSPKTKANHPFKTPIKNQVEKLTKLVEFYQSQKIKRSNSSEKNLVKSRANQTQNKIQRNATFLGKLPSDNSISIFRLDSPHIISSPRFLKEPQLKNNAKQTFTNNFPNQFYVHQPTRESNYEKKIEIKNAESANEFQTMMRKAFIPASKLKHSPRQFMTRKDRMD